MPLTFALVAAALLALALVALCLPMWRAVASADTAEATAPTRRSTTATTVALVLCLPAAAVALYAHLGEPGAAGGRPDDAADTASASYVELEAHLRRQPDDARALIHKARLDMQAQRHEVAAAGYARALAGASKAVRDPAVWVEYAEALGMAQGGSLAGQPRQLVDKALALDGDHAGALDLAGSAAWEARDFAGAARHWRRLLEQLPAGSARHAELSAAVERAEQRSRLLLPATR